MGSMREVQKYIQEKLGTDVKDIQFLRNMVLAATVELTEVMAESPWKPWKPENYKKVNKQRVIDELADVQIFILNIMLHHDIYSNEVQDAIVEKQAENIRRFKNDGVWDA